EPGELPLLADRREPSHELTRWRGGLRRLGTHRPAGFSPATPMNTQINYMIARQRAAELQRTSERTRLLTEVQSYEGAAAVRGRQGWMAVALVLMGAGWGSNQFTPMLLVYRHALGLSPGSLEAMFGVYALGLIPGLLAG